MLLLLHPILLLLLNRSPSRMDYTEVNAQIEPYSEQDSEIVVALLAQLGFDSFVDTSTGVIGYIPTIQFEDIDIKVFFKQLPLKSKIFFTVKHIKSQNWNKEWEKNFEPITVEKFCRVRAPFHEHIDGYQIEVVVEPKMAFGTGHHQTTWLMIHELFNTEIRGKEVLDMGCGTGILAIIAEKLGAKAVLAIDNDEWAFKNAIENVQVNKCNIIQVMQGDASLLPGKQFDVILANINRNVLLNDIKFYRKSLKSGGTLLLSGFFDYDIPTISKSLAESSLQVFASRAVSYTHLTLPTKRIV